MLTVYKYQLRADRYTRLELPVGAKVLSCGFQGQNLMLWALINKNQIQKERRTFINLGTGHEYEGDASKLTFIQTVFIDQFVFHIFEET